MKSAKNIDFNTFKAQVPSFKETQKVFKGARFNVFQIHLPGKNGNQIQREVIAHPGAVLILPLIDKENLLMIRNERFATGQTLWELPAGTLEPNEKPEETAKRELIEETGYKAAHIEPLLVFYTTPGFCNEVMYTYVAKDLSFVGQSLDESEKITVETVSWKKALKMVEEGAIIDGKTISALLYFSAFKDAD